LKKKTTLIFLFSLFFSFTIFSQEDFSIEELTGRATPKNSTNPYKLRGEVYEAYEKMRIAALQDNIKIEVVSAFRSYAHQQRIWNNKFKKFTATGLSDSLAVKKIIEYSTMPGTSRHHWGTDIDIVQKKDVNVKGKLLSTNFHDNGPYIELKKWLDNNAEKFGFKIVYTNDPHRKGFKYEPWHFTYYSTSSKMLECYIEKECFKTIDFQNNLGSSALGKKELDFYYTNYIKNP